MQKMNCAEQSTAEEIENGSMPMGSGAQTWRPGNAPRWTLPGREVDHPRRHGRRRAGPAAVGRRLRAELLHRRESGLYYRKLPCRQHGTEECRDRHQMHAGFPEEI
ncbi:hypothetical protein [Trichlorobacter ammonificans]|uniref:hypothetical protein n=1 Tax=Trichlorobacter ammonificans TaxID=2916410 RepID=UPI002737B4B8|nr:hypothetical protein [Trichlorobacter ammonificans]